VATGITDLSTFILGTIFIVLLPGPNSLYVMTLASRQGLLAGYRAACGIFVGDTVLMLLAATGAASALHASPAAFAEVCRRRLFGLAGTGTHAGGPLARYSTQLSASDFAAPGHAGALSNRPGD
jgi:hypothetical protein